MGIGLAIAHGLAPVIGATIAVASEPNKGSSFTVTVPRPTEDAAARNQALFCLDAPPDELLKSLIDRARGNDGGFVFRRCTSPPAGWSFAAPGG